MTATTHPTVWASLQSLVHPNLLDNLRRNSARPVQIGSEALGCLLARRGITIQRTKTWRGFLIRSSLASNA